MCTRVNCESCGKPDWRGCGRHVESILGDVRPADRCQCDKDRRRSLSRLLSNLFGGRR